MDEKLRAFWARLNQDLKDLWEKDRMFLIGLGAVILLVKFRDLVITLLVKSAKNIFNKAEQQDQQLANRENAANQQADDLVKKAELEPTKETPVNDDWFKNGK